MADFLDEVNVARPEKGLCELAQADVSTPRAYLKKLVDALYSVLMEVLSYTDILLCKLGKQSLESSMLCLTKGAMKENQLVTI